jgi:hypothetical protein
MPEYTDGFGQEQGQAGATDAANDQFDVEKT